MEMSDLKEVESRILLATGVGGTTLICSYGDFPRDRGNCFSVTTDKRRFRILNFVYENWEEMLRREAITLPIKILPISKRHAVVCDERIPYNWYSHEFCEVCCPTDLLPLPQRLRHLRQYLGGIRTENSHGDLILINISGRPEYNLRFEMDADEN